MDMRRIILTALAAAASAALALPAVAQQDYPSKPIRLVVPYAPGAITDTAARLVADRMSTVLGMQVVVDNRGGAGTRIGVQHVAMANPDGYTLLYVNSITHGSMPAMSKSLPFDPVTSFKPVTPLFWYANIFVCNPSVPANTIAELIDYAKKNPGKLTNATAGPGSGHDLLGSLFKSMTGTDITHVHYRGGGPALQDVLAGNVSCIYGDGNAKPLLDTGRLKAFATAGPQRDPVFPDVPTLDEAGVKGFSLPINQGIAAPAGTPAAVIAKLNVEINRVLANPDTRQRLADIGTDAEGGTPERFGKFIVEDIARWQRLIKPSMREK
ncbi:MAG: tripartite tricarboxylate transporter substrate binding protein [Betaproteobacteria bacterium]|nr:tripartite tricarboxylate transporter substrate binding protein [Betaproteobacteria bacterium]